MSRHLAEQTLETTAHEHAAEAITGIFGSPPQSAGKHRRDTTDERRQP